MEEKNAQTMESKGNRKKKKKEKHVKYGNRK